MTISELIKALNGFKAVFGDINVEVRNEAGDFDLVGTVAPKSDRVRLPENVPDTIMIDVE